MASEISTVSWENANILVPRSRGVELGNLRPLNLRTVPYSQAPGTGLGGLAPGALVIIKLRGYFKNPGILSAVATVIECESRSWYRSAAAFISISGNRIALLRRRMPNSRRHSARTPPCPAKHPLSNLQATKSSLVTSSLQPGKIHRLLSASTV